MVKLQVQIIIILKSNPSHSKNTLPFCPMLNQILPNFSVPQIQSNQPPYLISVSFRGKTNRYEIPNDLAMCSLIQLLRRVHPISQTQAVFMYLKNSSRLIGSEKKLSELIQYATLQVETNKEKDEKKAENQAMKKSVEFDQKKIVKCKAFIQLRMEAIQTTG